MILRSVAGQPILIGPLLAVADGTAQTTGAAIAVRKDGTDVGTPGGTLAHVDSGVWQYTPSQNETDCGIVGLILTKAGAAAVPLNVLTTRLPVQTTGAVPAVAAGSNGGLPLIGSAPLTNLDAAVSTRSTYAGGDTSGTTTLLGRLTGQRATNLDNLDAAISTRSSHAAADVWGVGTRTLTAFGFSVTVGTNSDKTGYSLSSSPPTAATIADAVWDELTADHTTAGTFGNATVIEGLALFGAVASSPSPTTTTFTITLASGDSFGGVAADLVGQYVTFLSGNRSPNATQITAATVNSTTSLALTVAALPAAPAATDRVIISE
jgi:hypothetical protein